MITPPQRILTFNSGLDHNDGMLVASVQRAEGISYEAASRKVKAAVEAMMSLMASQGYVRLGHVGMIERSEDSLTFTPALLPTPSADTLWLEPLSLEALDRGNIVDAPIIKREGSYFGRIARVAASIAVLIALGFVLSTPIHVSDSMLASLTPEFVKATPEQLVPDKDGEMSVLTVSLPLPADDSVIDITEQPRLVVEPDADYFVVVAALATLDEGRAYIAEHPGYNLNLSSTGKYYRVYTSAYSSPIEAYKASIETSKTFPGAWVCKK